MAQLILAPGDIVGDYIVEALIGGGGAGHVYKVSNADEDVKLAIKVSRYDLRELPLKEREVHARRLEREFNVLQANPHRYIIPVFGYGFDRELRAPYIAMELVQGPPLSRVLKENRLALRTLIETFRKTVEAVAYLHHKGVLHRDLKPSNILLRDPSCDPVLIDFGIVKAPWLDPMTHTEDRPGTWEYQSPECLAWTRDEPYPYRPTDDVFALGVVLYQILTGAMPFKAGPGGFRKIKVPAHPCELAKVPQPLGDLAMRMLALKPEQRPRNAQAVLDALVEMRDEVAPFLFVHAPELETDVFGHRAAGEVTASAQEEGQPGATTGEGKESLSAEPTTHLAANAVRSPPTLRPPRRSRDRVVLLVAALPATTLLAVALMGLGRGGDQPVSLPAPQCSRQSPGATGLSLPEWAVAVSAPSGANPLVPFSLPLPQMEKKARVVVPERPASHRSPRTFRTAILCTLATGHLACATVQVRSDEDFLAKCPDDAKATSERLGLSEHKYYEARMIEWPGKGRRPETPLFIKNGPVVSLVDVRGEEFDRDRPVLEGARLYGQARVESDRVSIQFYKLQLKGGEMLPVCAVAYTSHGARFGPGIQQWPVIDEPEPLPYKREALKQLQPGEVPISWPLHLFRVR